MALGVKVADVMSKPVVTVPPTTTVRDAARTMAAKNMRHVIVADKGVPVGVLSDGDIITRVLAKGKDVAKVSVRAVMSKPVLTIGPQKDVEDAARLMTKKGIFSLPVVSRGRLVGIITEKDIIKISPSLIHLAGEAKALGPPKTGRWRGGGMEGECDLCYGYSDDLRDAGGRMLCPECREAEE